MRRPIVLAVLAFALALALRLLNARAALVDGVPRLSPLDELYHAKRIVACAADFPQLPERDADRGTNGAWCPWPPLYDLTLGGMAWATGARGFLEVLARVVWLPPFGFALFVAVVTMLLARRRGALAGALAGGALATSPFLVDFASIGSIDHHWVEPALAFAIAYGTVADDRGWSRRVPPAVILGVAMIAAMFVQTALLIACALAFVVTLLLDPRRGAIAFTLLASAVALYAATRPAGYPAGAWFLGWPHAGIFAGAALALALRVRRAPAWLALAAGSALIAATPAAAEAVAGGSHFLGGDPWLRTISEFLPVLTEPLPDLLSDIALLSGGLLLVWPLAWRAWRTRDRAQGAVAFFAIIYLLLDLSSRRFRPLSISFLALAGALYAAELYARRRMLGIAAILLVALPPPIQLALWLRQPDTPVKESQVPWLRAAAFLQTQSPGGRVLAPWSMGHTLDVIGQRPVIVDNFGSMPGRVGFERAHDALLAKDEAALARYCDANAVRWIVFSNPLYNIPEAAAVMDVKPETYVQTARSGEAARVTKLAQATCWWRAYYFGGAAQPRMGMFGRPLTRFRRVYRDPQPAWRGSPVDNGPALEIWERTR
jgi:hypothetical protein